MASTQPFRLLYVCAANVGRSPLAAACTRSYLAANKASTYWRVESAGIDAPEGAPVRTEAESAAKELRVDVSMHAARTLDASDVGQYDLVLAMGWDQASHIWSAAPDSWAKAFTVKEFIHWSKQVAPKPAVIFPDRVSRMRDRVEQAHAIRRRARADHGFWGGLRPHDLNVFEPEPRSESAWRTFVPVVRTLTTDVVHLLGGP